MSIEDLRKETASNSNEFEHDPSEYLDQEDERLVGTFSVALLKNDLASMSDVQGRLANRISIIRDYETGAVPTYASYANVLESLIDKTKDIEHPEVENLRKLAEGRMRELRLGVRRYVERVAKYQHIRIRSLRDDDATFRDDLMKIDADRRKTHDALIETLETTGKVIAKLREIAREEADADAKVRAFPSLRGDADGDMIFDAEFIRDRKLVRDWAIAAWTVEQIRRAKEKAA